MNRKQFQIRHLLIALTVVAVLIVVLQWLAPHFYAIAPGLFFIATIVALMIGSFGFLITVFAGLLSLIVFASTEDPDRRENLKRSLNLAGIGFAMFIASALVLIVSLGSQSILQLLGW